MTDQSNNSQESVGIPFGVDFMVDGETITISERMQDACRKVYNRLSVAFVSNLPDRDVKPFCENKEEITKPAVIITASTFSFAREHFIGPLNRHLHRVIRGREVSAAFMMQAKPDRFLRQPLDVPEKQAVLAATIFFTQSFETLVGVLHGQTTIEKAVLIPLALDLFVNYSEYKTTFQAWRQYEIPMAYRTMQEDVRLLRVQHMLAEEGTPMRAVFENHIAYITNHIATLEREYPDLVGHIDPNELQDGDANNLIAYN